MNKQDTIILAKLQQAVTDNHEVNTKRFDNIDNQFNRIEFKITELEKFKYKSMGGLKMASWILGSSIVSATGTVLVSGLFQ